MRAGGGTMSFISATAPAKSTEKAPERHDGEQGLEAQEVLHSTQTYRIHTTSPQNARVRETGTEYRRMRGTASSSYWLAILPQVLKLSSLNDGLK